MATLPAPVSIGTPLIVTGPRLDNVIEFPGLLRPPATAIPRLPVPSFCRVTLSRKLTGVRTLIRPVCVSLPMTIPAVPSSMVSQLGGRQTECPD